MYKLVDQVEKHSYKTLKDDIKISSVECEKLELALLAINDIEVDEFDIY